MSTHMCTQLLSTLKSCDWHRGEGGWGEGGWGGGGGFGWTFLMVFQYLSAATMSLLEAPLQMYYIMGGTYD